VSWQSANQRRHRTALGATTWRARVNARLRRHISRRYGASRAALACTAADAGVSGDGAEAA